MPYAVTKAAQVQLVKCLAVTVGPRIRVNTVLPGLLLTEWVRITKCQFSIESTDNAPGTQVLARTTGKTQGGSRAQTRNLVGRLRGGVYDAGEEFEHDGHADPGGRWVQHTGCVMAVWD